MKLTGIYANKNLHYNICASTIQLASLHVHIIFVIIKYLIIPMPCPVPLTNLRIVIVLSVSLLYLYKKITDVAYIFFTYFALSSGGLHLYAVGLLLILASIKSP